jgi:hypothetical protein
MIGELVFHSACPTFGKFMIFHKSLLSTPIVRSATPVFINHTLYTLTAPAAFVSPNGNGGTIGQNTNIASLISSSYVVVKSGLTVAHTDTYLRLPNGTTLSMSGTLEKSINGIKSYTVLPLDVNDTSQYDTIPSVSGDSVIFGRLNTCDGRAEPDGQFPLSSSIKSIATNLSAVSLSFLNTFSFAIGLY